MGEGPPQPRMLDATGRTDEYYKFALHPFLAARERFEMRVRSRLPPFRRVKLCLGDAEGLLERFIPDHELVPQISEFGDDIEIKALAGEFEIDSFAGGLDP